MVIRPRARHFLQMAKGFWSGRTGLAAWAQTGLVLLCVAAQLAVAVGINTWNRSFFDALEVRDTAKLWGVVAWLPALVLLAALALSALLVSRLWLQMRWREFVTRRLAQWWIADQRYYRLQFASDALPAPEYRIAEDVRLAIEPLVEFVIGLITAAASAVTFAAILWRVAGSARFTVGEIEIVIPSYMALAAIGYAGATSLAAYLAGRPLVRRIAAKNEAEAQFRAEMTRLRENAESIALIKGDADERASVERNYGRVVAAWIGVIRQQGIVALVLNANSAMFPIVPLLLIAPKYLAGEVSLGAVMQIVAAFMAVQAALIWFVDNFLKLAEWLASVVRVDEFQEGLEKLDLTATLAGDARIAMRSSADDAIRIDRLAVAHSNGTLVIGESSVIIERGERVLIVGESGTGKSTLIRALAGIWPWGSGSIALPSNRAIAFVPQKPYIPLGSLRSVLLYPQAELQIADEIIVAALERCGLGAFGDRLGEIHLWDRILSGGERQKIAFARLLIQRPDIVIMDEATSALDEMSQASLLRLFDDELAGATLISVGHRTSLNRFHSRKITMRAWPTGALLSSRRMSGPARNSPARAG